MNFRRNLTLASIFFTWLGSGCALQEQGKTPPVGFIATPVSYYSTPKARYLASKYKENLERLAIRIVRDPETEPLQFANNISSVGGIGFFTHSATETPDDRYLEVVLATPETFESKGDYSEKVSRLFARYGRELLDILADDKAIYADRELSGYGLNLAWRNVVADGPTARVNPAHAVIYFHKERVLDFLSQKISASDLLADAVIFAVDDNGPLQLVSYQVHERRADYRPPIREDNLTTGRGKSESSQVAKSDRGEDKPLQTVKEEPKIAKSTTPQKKPTQSAAVQSASPIKAEPAVNLAPDAEPTNGQRLAESRGVVAGSDRDIASRTQEEVAPTPDMVTASKRSAETKSPQGPVSKTAAVKLKPAINNAPKPNAPGSSTKAAASSEKSPEAGEDRSRPGQSVATAAPAAPDVKQQAAVKEVVKEAAKSSPPVAPVIGMNKPKLDQSAQSERPKTATEAPPRENNAVRPAIAKVEKPAVAEQSHTADKSASPPLSMREKSKKAPPMPELKPHAAVPAAQQMKKNHRENTAHGPDLHAVAGADSGSKSGAMPEETRKLPEVKKVEPEMEKGKLDVVERSAAKMTEPSAASRSMKPLAAASRAIQERVPVQPATGAAAPVKLKPAREQLASLKKPTEPEIQKPPLLRVEPKPLQGFIIQIAFHDKDKAQGWAEKMAQRGYAVSVTQAGAEGSLRVRLGNFALRDEAERQLRDLKREGINGIIVSLPQAFRPDLRSSMP